MTRALSETSHRIVRGCLSALREGGELPDSMLTDDFSGWTVMSGHIDRAAYQAAFKLLSSLFEGGGPVITIRSLTAEQDRVAAEFQSEGDLENGAHYRNDYVFLFRIRDGRPGPPADWSPASRHRSPDWIDVYW